LITLTREDHMVELNAKDYRTLIVDGVHSYHLDNVQAFSFFMVIAQIIVAIKLVLPLVSFLMSHM
jgi:hypothetical protein